MKVASKRRLHKSVILCFITLALHSSYTLAASEMLVAQKELSAIKSELLSFVEIDPDIQRYAYLDIDPKWVPLSAELQILGANGSVHSRIRFSPTQASHGLIRSEFSDSVTKGTACRFLLEVMDGEDKRQYSLDCELPQLSPDSMLELDFRDGWLKPKLKFLSWNFDAEYDAKNQPSGHQLSSLLRRMVPSVTTRSFARADEGRAAAPDVRYSALICSQAPWRGLNRLYRYKQRYGTVMPSAFWWAYADCAVRAGVRSEAVAALQRLQRIDATQLSVYDTRLMLAGYDLRSGDIAGARSWMVAAPKDVPVQVRTRWRDIKSRIELQTGQFEATAALLSRGRHLQAAGNWLESFDAAYLHYVMRMNYAYALMSSDRADAALAVLDRIGSSPDLDAETRAVRELANMKLGWYFLTQGYGATAGRIFYRISTQGQVAREAMLGMGWAMLAPKGEARQLIEPPGFTATVSDPPATTLKSLYQTGAIGCAQFKAVTPDAIQPCMPVGKFSQVAYSQDPNEQRQRALRFWVPLLSEQGPKDAIFLEAHIAAANLYVQLGDQQRGYSLYQKTIEVSEEELAGLERLHQTLNVPQQIIELALGTRAVPGDVQPAVFKWLARADTQTFLGAIVATQHLASQLSATLSTSLRRSRAGVKLADLRGRAEHVQQIAVHQFIENANAMVAREQHKLERYRVRASLEMSEMQRVASHDSN